MNAIILSYSVCFSSLRVCRKPPKAATHGAICRVNVKSVAPVSVVVLRPVPS